MKKWLFFFLGFLLILEITQILLIIRAFELHFSELFFAVNVIRILSGVGLIGLMISPFFFPEILYGLPRVPEPNMEENQEKITETSLPDRENANQYNFETSYLYSIGHMTDSCMKEYQPYLQPDCNLTTISKLVKIPVHHLGYYFSQVKNQHFTEYRNEWRINHAKKLIIEGKIKITTLENIGLQSGFTNRNTFLTAFKRLEGTSPHVYATLYKQQFMNEN